LRLLYLLLTLLVVAFIAVFPAQAQQGMTNTDIIKMHPQAWARASSFPQSTPNRLHTTPQQTGYSVYSGRDGMGPKRMCENRKETAGRFER
jgi:hypothetical protein